MTTSRETSLVGSHLPRHLETNGTLSRWVTVEADGTVSVRVGKVELGQGILTALAQLAAEELDVDVDRVHMVPANTATSPDEGLTSGSMSIVDSGPAVSLVCANVRARFVAAAARSWSCEDSEVSVEHGRLHRATAGLATSYAAMAAGVDLDVEVDPDIPLRSGAGRWVGTSVARIDLPGKMSGRPVFIHDLRLPGMLFGRVVRPPSPGAVLLSLEADVEVGLAPAVRVVRDGSFLGVVADSEAVAVRSAELLRRATSWAEHDTLPDETRLSDYLRSGPHESQSIVADSDSDSDSDSGSGAGDRTLKATYHRPFLAHASMAPSCGVARWDDTGGVAVWSHSQGIFRLRDAIASALAKDADRVTVTHAEGAGCYGHNGADDAAFDAVLLSRSVPGRPVHVQWSRHDELTWSPFGSAMTADVSATLDPRGHVASWEYNVYSQGHTSRPGYEGVPGLLAGAHLQKPLAYPAAADPPHRSGGGASRNAVPCYDFAHRRISTHRLLRTPLRSSALRSLGAFLNVFAIESFVDELAALAGLDPLAFRLAHLADERGRAVLERAAGMAGWGSTRTGDGIGSGIGFARYKHQGAYCAVVAEVEADTDIRVRRLFVAVDVGRVVNPDGVRNQIEGGCTQATSWTLKERVRFDRTRVTSTDWESYPILRFSESPRVDVDILSRPDLPSVGSGEAAQGPTAAAIGNAVADALGVRVRGLPINAGAVVKAIQEQED